MSLYEHIRNLGLGSLLLVIARALYAFVGAIEKAILMDVFYNNATPAEVQTSLSIAIGLSIVALVLFLYGTRLMKKSSEAIGSIITDLSGLATGYKLFFRGIIGTFIFAIALAGVVLSASDIEAVAGIALTLGGLLVIFVIIFFVGLLLIGTRTKNLTMLGYNTVGPSYLILLGAILIFFSPMLSGALLLIGFLRLGVTLYFSQAPPADVVTRIAEELEAEMEKEGFVNLMQFASQRGYPIRFVIEAAFGLAEKKGYKIANGMLVKGAVM